MWNRVHSFAVFCNNMKFFLFHLIDPKLVLCSIFLLSFIILFQPIMVLWLGLIKSQWAESFVSQALASSQPRTPTPPPPPTPNCFCGSRHPQRQGWMRGGEVENAIHQTHRILPQPLLLVAIWGQEGIFMSQILIGFCNWQFGGLVLPSLESSLGDLV